jgi:hypothetical protein
MKQREDASRLDYTLMVNHCVVPTDGGGGYKLCTVNNHFKEWHTEYKDRYGKDLQKGEPKDIYCWRVFHGNYQALESCITRGVVKEKIGKDLTCT